MVIHCVRRKPARELNSFVFNNNRLFGQKIYLGSSVAAAAICSNAVILLLLLHNLLSWFCDIVLCANYINIALLLFC